MAASPTPLVCDTVPLGQDAIPTGVAYHSGAVFVVDTGTQRILMLSVDNAVVKEFALPYGATGFIYGLAVSPAGDLLAVSGATSVWIYSVGEGKLVRTITPAGAAPGSVALLSDGSLAVANRKEPVIAVYNANSDATDPSVHYSTYRELRSARTPGDDNWMHTVRRMVTSTTDDTQLYVCDMANMMHLVDTGSGEIECLLQFGVNYAVHEITALAVDHGLAAVYCHKLKQVIIRELKTDKRVARFSLANVSEVYGLAFATNRCLWVSDRAGARLLLVNWDKKE